MLHDEGVGCRDQQLSERLESIVLGMIHDMAREEQKGDNPMQGDKRQVSRKLLTSVGSGE